MTQLSPKKVLKSPVSVCSVKRDTYNDFKLDLFFVAFKSRIMEFEVWTAGQRQTFKLPRLES